MTNIQTKNKGSETIKSYSQAVLICLLKNIGCSLNFHYLWLQFSLGKHKFELLHAHFRSRVLFSF